MDRLVWAELFPIFAVKRGYACLVCLWKKLQTARTGFTAEKESLESPGRRREATG